ncbi:hypothetical protein [Jonquetella anthropi]|uniref:hypothetical protein n=1 Tax=Jonquetella anthropi TaxID=428712 RepID=UPI00155A5221|nr:hypothetical protein [Jonquetella anthropi]
MKKRARKPRFFGGLSFFRRFGKSCSLFVVSCALMHYSYHGKDESRYNMPILYLSKEENKLFKRDLSDSEERGIFPFVARARRSATAP